MFAGLELGQQLFDGPLDLGELCDKRLPVHLSCNITIAWKYTTARICKCDENPNQEFVGSTQSRSKLRRVGMVTFEEANLLIHQKALDVCVKFCKSEVG